MHWFADSVDDYTMTIYFVQLAPEAKSKGKNYLNNNFISANTNIKISDKVPA